MANIHRGEIDAIIGGKTWVLCLTLGALAELENRLEVDDLLELGERFSSGRVSAKHLIVIIGAGLRGAGNDISDEELSTMSIDDGLRGAAVIAANLLKATFGGEEA
jgi:hypothetical protein